MQLYAPSTIIDQRYSVTRLLGSSGASAVYEARDLTCDLPVALRQNGLPQADFLVLICHRCYIRRENRNTCAEGK